MRDVELDDKYRVADGTIFLSGIQALVRLLLEQRRSDASAGLSTAGFVSGYRGSPLGGVDFALWQAAAHLERAQIRFEPGLNEEIAATMVQGSQQVGAIGGSRVDGVFGLWYAKNPGVDRAGDALKHANAAGTAARGGVLAVSGDDPGATSSTIANQCEHAFISASIPVLAPASVAEILDYGLIGYGLSRYAGVWVGLKAVADVVEASETVVVRADRPPLVLPEDLPRPAAGWGMRWPDSRWDQEARLLGLRLPAAKAYARANRLDAVVFGSARPRIGIVTAGKAMGDVLDALALIGIDRDQAEALGLAVYKVGMVWPLEPVALRAFAEGLEEILVVEERRAIIEPQLKEQAYNWPAKSRPVVVGKADERGAPLLPEGGVLTPTLVAEMIARRLALRGAREELRRVRQELRGVRQELRGVSQELRGAAAPLRSAGPEPTRTPHFCAGCPHARSTRVPDGGLAMAGIGCHSLRLGMPDSKTMFLVPMGNEGTNWIGAAPFVERGHVFQNLGDGTYMHSGSLAVRAAVAARARMTFRILYNGAVAMTGGQPVEGAPGLGRLTQLLLDEGVARVVVVSEEPDRHRGALASGVELHDRDALERVERELSEIPAVTALVYDQMCAIEKRRHRKRGTAPPIARRVYINERVCEDCGDCLEQSQCAALMPAATDLGPKRRIDQSACNADYSCLDGFCPSFVMLEGAQLRAAPAASVDVTGLTEPVLPSLQQFGEIIIAGVGGTGVMTVGAILGMAAHLEGRGCTVLDDTGIARKGGAVSTHIRLTEHPGNIHASRIGVAQAKLLIGGDLLVSAHSSTLACLLHGRTQVILNVDATPTLNQRLDPTAEFDPARLRRAVDAAVGEGAVHPLHATMIAERLLGDAIYSNMVLIGASWQLGLLPLSREAIARAIDLNGTGAAANWRAFELGRLAAHDPARLGAALVPKIQDPALPDLDTLIITRVASLTAYQDAAYARRYRELVDRARKAEADLGIGDAALARAVANGYFRLLAIKDEYEVARLYTDGEFRRELERRFEGPWRLHYHLAPPVLARMDARTGRPRKRRFGPWIEPGLRFLARCRRLRGSWLDPFGHTAERRQERRLIVEYERSLAAALARLTPRNHALVVEFAALPERMRGFGPVKARNVSAAQIRAAEILGMLDAN
ncbi:MAG: indolepyruvate ferredoxin oxidoreductase family protein [Steroidobacteraceae bacterium]